MLWATCSIWSTRVTSVPDDLDDLSGVPRYLQVARVIEAEIRAGQWTPRNAVPSRNQLAERFGIARETAARAHAWLARAGYLVAVPGVGMVVTPASRWPKKPSDAGLEPTSVLSVPGREDFSRTSGRPCTAARVFTRQRGRTLTSRRGRPGPGVDTECPPMGERCTRGTLGVSPAQHFEGS
jgi:GntR family transcriptional regulator